MMLNESFAHSACWIKITKVYPPKYLREKLSLRLTYIQLLCTVYIEDGGRLPSLVAPKKRPSFSAILSI
jgi:hypothetical protein